MRFFTKTLTAIITVFIFSTTFAQTIVTIGTGTGINSNTNYPAPYGNWYWGAKHQILIKASELTAAGASAGNISALAFNVATIQGTPLQGFTIKMAATTVNNLTTTFATPSFTTVYGPQTYTETAGWNTHTFTTSFNWNGTSNILIEVCFNNSSYTNNAQMYYSTTSYTSCTYANADNSNVCSFSSGNTANQRPNMKLTFPPQNVPPVAAFKANKQYTCDGVIAFTDSSCCNITSRTWNFGDGTTSTAQNPSHTYTSSGTYNVSLSVTNAYGNDTEVKNGYITVALSGGVTAAACTPTTTGYCCGFGITNVTFNTINFNSADASDGYQDYTCSQGTTVYAGANYNISVSTPAPTTHNVRVWIDYNNDGTLDPATEEVLAVNNSYTATGTIMIPSNAVTNTPLRMRVSADFDGFAVPTPCADQTYGQTEDYAVTIIQNNYPPQADFSADATTTCSGTVQFTDNSQFGPTSWLWNFGDGNTDTLQNTAHTYFSSGTYTVTLIASNANGSDTIIKNNYINVVIGGQPINASCTPQTASYCCGYGIYNVNLNTINHSSPNASEGYKDYSCLYNTTLTEGMNYLLSILTTVADSQDTKVWIDWDNSGSFNSGELVMTSLNHSNPSAYINVPGGVVLNTPLRMRISSDYSGSNPGPCTNLYYGQCEDYGVTIIPNTNPPVAYFTGSPLSSCDGIISFTDSTLNAPDSWHWDFGDGDTSNMQNPAHTYTTTGQYTITLIVSNNYGSDTLIKTNYINIVSTTGGPIAASCTPATTGYCCGMGIYNVTLNSLNNSSNDGADGYVDYGCTAQTSMIAGNSYSIYVTTGATYTENVKVWIDYNNNGVFNNTNELVFSHTGLLNHNGTITIPSGAVMNAPLRMRVISDYNSINNACNDVMYGQAEDYTIVILPNTVPPVANFTANSTTTCNGIVVFNNTTTNGSSFFWDFGDGTTSTQSNPTHTYGSVGTYTVFMRSCNAYGCDSITKTNYITVTTNGPVNASCSPQTTSYCCGMGIYNVTFNTINNTTSDGIDGYKDYTCTNQTSVTAGQNYTLSITTGSTYSENVSVWIDYDNNGNFTAAEQVYTNYGFQTHTSSISLSSSAVMNTPLRMRVASDYNTIAGACNNVMYGQVEDYTVTIIPNTVPPVVDFTAGSTTSCNGTITFINSTTNGASFFWDFGDGTTSTQSNPTHTYTAAGTYTVFLKSCNAYGCDSLTKTNYITISTNGPIAATCTSQTTAYCCGIGIYNVTFNTINNTTSDGIDGYKDYSCSYQTSVTAGQNYNLSVTTNSMYSENVMVWIDYNNDGSFNNTNELMYSNSGLMTHSTVIAPSSSAVLNTPLRMRVASDYNAITGPCANVMYGQAEDYSIIILPNTVPPVVDFTATATTSCNGLINFINNTANGTSFIWDFGDGTTSTQQNPTHTYSTAGTYSVSLKSCNTYGCDSLLKNNYITISTGGPINATCSPQTTSYCCGMGIYNFTFNTINNSTNDGVDGYKDYSCTQQTTVISGVSYNLSVTTGTNYSENVSVWIDYNNDGNFTTSELVYSNYSLQYHSGAVSIPSTATFNTPLRVRVASDYNTIGSACNNVMYGQVEDYTVTIQPNTVPPVVDFTATSTTSCNGVISFVNNTTNGTSFIWDFGDGSTSTQQNPTHTYSSSGTFSVFLKSCNNYGCDSLLKVNYITISGNGPVTAACTPATTSYCCGIGIYNVTFNTINNTTADGIDGYKDYSCTHQTSITIGQNYSLSITTNSSYNENVWVWIDFNNNGYFNNTNELVYTDNGMGVHTTNINAPAGSVLNTPLRMRIASDYNTIIDACTNVYYGQFEDYAVTLLTNAAPPVVSFSAQNTASCNGLINFINSTTNATGYLWDFGDGVTSTTQTPSHTYTNLGNYTVMLKACNQYGCDSLIQTNFITITTGGPQPASCAPATLNYCCGRGITKVTFGSINNTSNDGVDGYMDYTCTQQATVVEGANYSLSVTTGSIDFEFLNVYADYNNDGSFSTSELIYTDYGLLTHTGNITIPGTVVFNTPIRMRVISDFNYIPNSCNDVNFGQAEDYTLTIVPNTTPPVVDFDATPTYTCDGVINFNNTTVNATSYFWDFGDGTTSTQQNPTHTYTTAGTYSVMLKACNAYGCDSLILTNYITYNSVAPVSASCVPATVSYCCGMGIYNVSLNTINNTSNNGIDGYSDYTCTIQTNLTEQQSYSLSVTTGSGYNENVKVYIDYNNDGILQSTELVYSDSALQYHNGNITIPSTAVTNVPLRLRAMSDYLHIANSCTGLMYGQAEDYTVTILPYNAPPDAQFTSTFNMCNTTVDFTDQSLNNPTTWHWSFGDNDSSLIQHPSHTYSGPGTYSVTLITSNAFGTDTITQNVSINSSVASFSVADTSIIGTGVAFSNSSTNATSYIWDFGDSTMSVSVNPTHVYNNPGTYSVTLITNNVNGCTDTVVKIIVIVPDGVKHISEAVNLQINPNPSSGIFRMTFNASGKKDWQMKVTDIAGNEVLKETLNSTGIITKQIDLSAYSDGVYFIQLSSGSNSFVRKITVQR